MLTALSDGCDAECVEVIVCLFEEDYSLCEHVTDSLSTNATTLYTK